MSEEIKFDHFKNINELLEHIDLWYREDDIEYTRWFGLEDLHILKIYITSLQQKVEQLEKENIRQKEIIENLTTMTVCGDKKQIKNTAQCKLEQLENIRKEAIEYIKDWQSFPHTNCTTHNELKNLLNILNKGDNNGK